LSTISPYPLQYQLFGLNFGFWRPPLYLWSEAAHSPAQPGPAPVVTSVKCKQQLLSCSLHCTAVHSTQPPVFVVFFYETVKKMDEPDPPFYPSLSRTNSGMSDVSSAQSTSSQASDQSDRTPTQDDLLNDNWAYLRDYFVMTATPDVSKNVTYKCILCLHSKPNHNKRKRDSDGIVSSPSSRQKSIADYRGVCWGKPGQPVSNKQMNDAIVDYFVVGMVPLVVSSVSVLFPPPLPVQFCFLGVFE